MRIAVGCAASALVAAGAQPLACYPPEGLGRAFPALAGLPPPGVAPTGLLGDPGALLRRSAHPLGFVGGRFFAVGVAWAGEAALGPAGQAVSARLAFSFALDGASWGEPAFAPPGPSELLASIEPQFGAGDLDLGLEYLRAGLAAWSSRSGVRFFEVGDDGAPMFDARNRSFHGDIRIGGRPYGDGSFLAYAYLPESSGHLTLNTSYFLGNFAIPDNSYRLFRNMFAHEVGHTLGLLHATPCDGTKLMEPRLVLGIDLLGEDEIRAANFSYGDRFAGNATLGAARDLGALGPEARTRIVERGLSAVAPEAGPGASVDWFRVSLDRAARVRAAASPTGSTYANGLQDFACAPSEPPLVRASRAGALEVRIFDQAGIEVAAGAAGVVGEARAAEADLPAGAWFVCVRSVGGGDEADQFVQMYDLEINLPGAASQTPAAPTAVAGVDKRVRAGTRCFFLGDLSSRANDPGAALTASSFDWDLDGDGVFETLGQPRPVATYLVNGVVPVTLRVTDSAGGVAAHTISVTVFGGGGAISRVEPARVRRGSSEAVVVRGRNFEPVVLAREVTVSGGGVTVTGRGRASADGSAVMGLGFVVDEAAAPGLRTLTIETPDGPVSAAGALLISAGPACDADVTGDGVVNFADLAVVLGHYGFAGGAGESPGDANLDGRVNFEDLCLVLGAYGGVCAGSGVGAGCR